MSELIRALTLVTSPSIEPVSIAELKEFARIDFDDEDGLLDSFIAEARVAAENYTSRAFITQTWKLSLSSECSELYESLGEGVYDLPITALYGTLPKNIILSRWPLQSITSVTTYDTSDTSSTFSSSYYRLDIANNQLILKTGSTWPSNLRQVSACEIITVNGYGDNASDVPAPIRTAIMMHAAQLYETRGMCGCDVPDACRQRLDQYRIRRL